MAKIRLVDINEQFIVDYCVKNGKVEWYISACSKPSKRIKKNGTPCKISFFEVRQMFVEEYMPELLPEKKEADNFRTRALALRNL